MQWDHSNTASYGDDGAMVVKTDGEWEAFPFGADGGLSGRFATRDEAIALAESIVAGSACCGIEPYVE